MGGKQTKEEEVIIAQNAAAGSNNARVDQLMYNFSFLQTILLVLCILISLAVAIFMYRMYIKFHNRLIGRRLNEFALREYARGPKKSPPGDTSMV